MHDGEPRFRTPFALGFSLKCRLTVRHRNCRPERRSSYCRRSSRNGCATLCASRAAGFAHARFQKQFGGRVSVDVMISFRNIGDTCDRWNQCELEAWLDGAGCARAEAISCCGGQRVGG